MKLIPLAIVGLLALALPASAAVYTGRVDAGDEIDDIKFAFAGGTFDAEFAVTPDTPGATPLSFYSLWRDDYATLGVDGLRLQGVATYSNDLVVPNLPSGNYRVAVQVSSLTADAAGVPDPIERYAYALTINSPVSVSSLNGMDTETPVPEPAVAMAGMAGVLMLGRRR